MKDWFERGGWVLVLAFVLLFIFCFYAQSYLGPDSGVNVPFSGLIDLLSQSFVYPVFASVQESEIETIQGLEHDIPPEAIDSPDIELESPIVESPSDLDVSEEDISGQQFDEPQNEDLSSQLESVETTEILMQEEQSTTIDNKNRDNEPVEYDGPSSGLHEVASAADNQSSDVNINDIDTISEIRDSVNIILFIFVFCISVVIGYFMLRPLWWFIFY